MRAAVAVAVVALTGCLVPHYVVQRSARVPHPAAPLRTGEELHGPVEVSLGEDVAAEPTTPKLHDESTAIESPNRQARGELRVRLGQRAELAAVYVRSLEGSFRPLQSGLAPGIEGTPSGGGLAFRYSIPLSNPHWTVGLGFDLMTWSVPYIEYRTCVSECEGVPKMEVNRDTTTVGSLGVGVTPTWRSGNWRVFGGVYAARHPTIIRKGSEIGSDTGTDVDGGPYNAVLHAGVELRMDNFAFLVAVDQDVSADPVAYGPTIGFAVSAALPDKKQPQVGIQ